MFLSGEIIQICITNLSEEMTFLENNCNTKIDKCIRSAASNASTEGREKMANLSNTQYFKVKTEPEVQVKEVLDVVYTAMEEKGYNPVNQIVGYIMSGDPTYITSHNNARSLIMKVERDELIEETVKYYINNKLK